MPLAVAGSLWLALMFIGRKATVTSGSSGPLAPAGCAGGAGAGDEVPDSAAGKDVEPGQDDGDDEGGPDTAEHPQTADRGKVDRTSPWIYFWAGTFLVVGVSTFMWHLHQLTPPANAAETGVRAEIWLFLAIPGVSLAFLGVYLRGRVKDGWVQYRLDLRDHLVTAVQLLPGTAIAAAGNILPPDHELVASWWINPGWASLGLGTLVSILLVRKFEDPAKTSSTAQLSG